MSIKFFNLKNTIKYKNITQKLSCNFFMAKKNKHAVCDF